jgi:hypothetical protein
VLSMKLIYLNILKKKKTNKTHNEIIHVLIKIIFIHIPWAIVEPMPPRMDPPLPACAGAGGGA